MEDHLLLWSEKENFDETSQIHIFFDASRSSFSAMKVSGIHRNKILLQVLLWVDQTREQGKQTFRQRELYESVFRVSLIFLKTIFGGATTKLQRAASHLLL